MLPKTEFSKPIFGHPAGSTKLDRPHRKHFQFEVSMELPMSKYWARGSAEQIWGDFFNLVRRILGKLPANLIVKFDSEFWWRMFWPCFSKASGSPKHSRPKFTPKLVGISFQFHFLKPKIYSRPAHRGDQKIQSAPAEVPKQFVMSGQRW